MKIAKTVVMLSTLAMASIRIYRFTVGDFRGESGVLLSIRFLDFAGVLRNPESEELRRNFEARLDDHNSWKQK